MEPWHADIEEFLELRKNTGKEEIRARDLFYALWIPDLFMKRVESDGEWNLFCPNEAKGLQDCWGNDFDDLYSKYEATPGLSRKTIKAQDLWFRILDSQIETGTPYMLYKDSANRKSNQQNLGTIKSSNLCCEIIEYTSPDEVAVCNLASISLPACVIEGKFDHFKLFDITKVITKNLNRIIDGNYYPIKEAETSNRKHRPIGIGIQGLADVFIKLRFPWDSEGARTLNRDIMETIYFAAITASNELAIKEGYYETFPGSPMSKGIFQFDMWNVKPNSKQNWDWDSLKQNVIKRGVRNSLMIAPMPTASTSQILANNECFEPYTSNIYTRRVLAGEFTILNRQLILDMEKLGLFKPDIVNEIIAANGSIQGVDEIPQDLKDLYLTVWEIPQRLLVDMAVARGAFVDQSQSFNLHIAEPDYAKLTSCHFYTWKQGLKTGMYYLRTRPATDSIKFTVDKLSLENRQNQKAEKKKLELEEVIVIKEEKKEEEESLVCTRQEGCITCGS